MLFDVCIHDVLSDRIMSSASRARSFIILLPTACAVLL